MEGRGQLSARLESLNSRKAMFSLEQRQKRLGPTLGASLASHAAIALLAFAALRYTPRAAARPTQLLFQPNRDIVWLNVPGDPGGGGGGGNHDKNDPPRQAEMPGKDKLTVPVAKPPSLEAPPQTKTEPNPLEQLAIPAKSLAAALESVPGVLEAPAGPPTLSQGSGSDGGAGAGKGRGIGPGNGPGLGPGDGGNFGGGPYRVGGGVSPPIEIYKGTPRYTADAMHARIQGSALVECVVQTDGICADIHVVRSLDRSFGLDQEAIKAAQLWRFRPGMRFGQPVPVLVTIEVAFTLR
jgi:protein TonB